MSPAPTPTLPPFQAATRPSSLAIISRVAWGSDSSSGAMVDRFPEASLAVTSPATAARGNKDKNNQNAISAESPNDRLLSSRVHTQRTQPTGCARKPSPTMSTWGSARAERPGERPGARRARRARCEPSQVETLGLLGYMARWGLCRSRAGQHVPASGAARCDRSQQVWPASIPIEAASIPIEAASLAIVTASLAIVTASIPIEAASLAIEAASLAIVTASLAIEAASIVIATASIPIEAASIPMEAASIAIVTASIVIATASIAIATASIVIEREKKKDKRAPG
jgi:hypothetical protein